MKGVMCLESGSGGVRWDRNQAKVSNAGQLAAVLSNRSVGRSARSLSCEKEQQETVRCCSCLLAPAADLEVDQSVVERPPLDLPLSRVARDRYQVTLYRV